MTTAYTCYFIGATGRIVGRRDFRDPSHRDAMDRARMLAETDAAHGYELWEGMRYVCAETRRSDNPA